MANGVRNKRTYQLLPFRFLRFNDCEVLVTNEVGEFLFLNYDDFQKLITHELDVNATFLDLKARHILTDTDVDPIVEMLATKYRTKKSFLNNFTALHMVVPTLRCNSNCRYCQVSRKDVKAHQYDMDERTAKKIVDLIFESPSPAIKIEFQGGEPLLNFNVVKYIIEYAIWKNLFRKKDLQFVICTNLSLITEGMLKYLKKYPVNISTSLDGPADLHNKNRPLQESEDSYTILKEKIALCRHHLGMGRVAALMTASRFSLGRFRDIVDEYISMGFQSIFFRALNPYGYAKRDRSLLGYAIDDFVDSYVDALDYIIQINLKGTYFAESFATLLLTRMLTPFSTGFVDMQSPAGVAISGVVYDYDGSVYVSDEARMLAAMGDKKFLMGNVNSHSYQELFNSEFVRSLIGSACLECVPICSDCAYQSFCGADPVRNYAEQGDIVGNPVKSDVCKRNRTIIKRLLEILRLEDESIENVLWSWIRRTPLSGCRQY